MPEKRIQLLLLQAAIELLYLCDARHLESVWVDEQFQGACFWEGDVEVFEIKGHPKATRCYAWLRPDESGRIRPVALLNKFPVSSPETAVRASIALDASMNSDNPTVHKLLGTEAMRAPVACSNS